LNILLHNINMNNREHSIGTRDSAPVISNEVAILCLRSIAGGTNTAPDLADAPEYLLDYGLEQRLTANGWKVSIHHLDLQRPSNVRQDGIYNLSEVCDATSRIAQLTKEQRDLGRVILALGGDHTIDMGVVPGVVAAACGQVGVAVYDGHHDANTPETSFTGNSHGMVTAIYAGKGHPALLAACNGHFVDPHHICMIGAQTEYPDFYLSHPSEMENLRRWGIRYVTKPELDHMGSGIKPALPIVDDIRIHVREFFSSLDMDVIDRRFAPAVAMPNPNGLHRDDVLGLCRHLRSNPQRGARQVGMSVVEINPSRNGDGSTAELALTAIEETMGSPEV
jgi:arginase